MSQGDDFIGSWNEGKSPELGEKWTLIDDPIQHIHETMGLLNESIEGSDRTEKSIQKTNKELSKERKTEIEEASAPVDGVLSWSTYDGD